MVDEPGQTGSRVTARRVTIRGVVQGVGFRPFVFRAAAESGVRGWVLNNENGVEIHVEGSPAGVKVFVSRLSDRPPPSAVIAGIRVEPADPGHFSGFEIRHSRGRDRPTARISPDLATCDDCLAELLQVGDRRQDYPYINCTNCGPRFSIILRLPYDRESTTMAEWELCPECRREYEDPLNRRFHAQPTACPACGPHYCLVESGRRLSVAAAAIQEAASRLGRGDILAVKGIGGYHLACDARNAASVAQLRSRKFRKEKPFAIMARSLEEARELAQLQSREEDLLLSVARPIVIAEARQELPGVAPGNAYLGVMLPYSPLHSLLFEAGAPSPLVLTSANRSSEPIAYRDEDALERLAGLADAFLLGERPIARRIDDSVAAVRLGEPILLRRARGYAPAAVSALNSSGPILALGADLKNGVALAVGGQVFLSQYIGQLGSHDCNSAFTQAITDLLEMYQVDITHLTIAHDLHPEFFSTRQALGLGAARRIGVQHHRAHIASVLAEQEAWDVPVVGLAFDGTGYGDDTGIWGGEVFVGSLEKGLRRVAHLREAVLPGGDAAARFPVQAAAGFLSQLDHIPDLSSPPFRFPNRFGQALSLVAKQVRTFHTTSMGRLFDCVAALCGFTREVTFEGQAAIWLEQRARCTRAESYPFPGLDYRPLLEAVIRDRQQGRPVEAIARAFHEGVASASAKLAKRLCRQYQVKHVVASGGVFQNQILLEAIQDRLVSPGGPEPGITLWINRFAPANDGGIALGQAALAAFS